MQIWRISGGYFGDSMGGNHPYPTSFHLKGGDGREVDQFRKEGAW